MLFFKNTDPSGRLPEGLARNEIPFVLRAPEGATCGSKIGGKPDVPADFVWPEFECEIYDGVRARLPLSFLCQIRLEEAAPFDRDGLLPKKGLLSFFYELSSHRGGYDPTDRGCFRVFYFEDAESLAPADPPEGAKELKEYGLSFSSGESYPAHEELCFRSDMRCDWDTYHAMLASKGYAPECARHKLLGYANVFQGEILSVCARNAESPAGGAQKTPGGDPSNWILLFQMASIRDGDFRLLFGDDGNLYFYIRKEDLQNKRFDKAWFVLQSY